MAVLGAAFVALTFPGIASASWLAWNEDGAAQITVGPNASLTIDNGAFTVVTSGCTEGVNDSFTPATDIYVIATGSASNGAALVDLSGSENAVFGASGGFFISETIAFTKPGGNLPGGVYDVVYDECQDGKFNAAVDSVFATAITVNIPPAGVPPADPAIAAIKNAAGQQAVDWLKVQFTLTALLTALDAYEKVQCALDPIDCFFGTDALIGYAVSAAQHALGVDDPKEAALAALANQVKHYQAIKLDPPDPAFGQVTTVGPVSTVQAQSDDPVVVQTAALARAASREQALAEALLHAVERYQGADAAGDGEWALAQARAMKEYGAALAAQIADTTDALEAFGTALAADGRALDDYAADLEELRAHIEADGFSQEELQALRNAGYSQAEVDQLREDFTADSYAATKADLQADIAQQVATAEDAVAALADFDAETDTLIGTLEADPGVFAMHPVADAGGPYTVAEGVALALDGTGSGARPGATIANYAWDLDGDGAFDDASGASPSFTYNAPRTGLVGLRITDDEGWADTAYAELTVTEANAPPVIESHLPALLQQIVPVGTSQTFSVTTSDPESDPVTVAWSVDGAAAATGPSFTYAVPATAGTHIIRAVAADGPTGGTAAMAWSLTAEEPDADGDGWNANVDCVDSDPAIPGDREIVGNGLDDDCDAATPDSGSAPEAGFSQVVSPGLAVAFTDASTDANEDIVSWAWDFGDGATSTAQNPSHTYAVKDTYTVTLTVTDATSFADTVEKQIVVASAPAASFIWAPPSPVNGGELLFTDTSTDSDGTVESWSWDFGDGGTSTEQHPAHIYLAPDTYAVTLTVVDDDGAEASVTHDVVVGAADPATAPAALFRPDVPGKDLAAVANGGTVVASSGWCCGGHEPWQMLDDDVGWPWATSNAAVGHFASIQVSPTPRLVDEIKIQPRSDGWFEQRVKDFAIDVSTTGFANADFTQVLLATAADNGTLQTFALPAGTTAKYVRYRPLSNRGGCCNISTSKFKAISASSGPRTVTFQNQSTNAETYSWTFGDGGTSTAANPTHTYATIGLYTVTLVAKAADGRKSTFTRQYEARGPTADFAVEPAVPEPGQPAVFTDESLYPTSPGASFAWNFGDGTTSTSAGTLHTFAAAGTYTVTHTVTDQEGNADTVTKTVTVAAPASDAPPTAGFNPQSAGSNVAASEAGASIASSSGQYSLSYPATTLIDADPNNSYWATPSGTPTNGWIKIDLAGGTQVVDRVRIYGRGGSERVRNFEVWASTTGTADADFTQVLAATNPNDDAMHEYVLPTPAPAAYLLLKVLNNHGSSCCIGVAKLEAWTGPERGGRNLALAADGAAIAGFSGQYDPNAYPVTSLIDGDPGNNPWLTTNGSITGFAKITLSNATPRLIDRVRIQPRWGGQKVKDFQVAVSTTGTADTDFVTVLSATAADNENLQTFVLPYPLPAKHVLYRVLSNRNNCCFTGTGDLRADTGQEATSRTIRFQNLSRNATSYEWDFGDGSTSTEAHPVHTYADAGIYTVTLTATNANGSTTFTLEQVIREASFSYAPAAPEAQQQIDFSDTTPSEIGLQSWSWSFGDGTTSTFQKPLKTYTAPGTYTVTMTGTDRDGNQHVATRSVVVAAPAFRAQFHPRGTFNMASLENGAAVLAFSSRYPDSNWWPEKLLDGFANTAWHSNHSPAESSKWIKFSLAGGKTYQIDRLQLLGRQDCCFDQHPRDFEIAVSTTGTADADFKTVLKATLPASQTTLQTFMLPRPVLAKYVLYRALNNRGSSVVTTAMLRAASGQVNTPTVTFDDLTVGGVAPLTYSWDFGDGSAPSTDASPTHTFPGPGTYDVTLTVTDGTGATSSYTLQQRILNAPVPSFTNSPLVPNETQSTTFTDTTPSPADGPIIERRWSWGDGTANTNTLAAATTHAFADNGSYDVRLEVQDAWGQTASVTRAIAVANVNPTVEAGRSWRWREDRVLTATPTTGDIAGSRDPVTCAWTYGDGTPGSTGCAFSHTYADTGTYTATVTVSDGDGGTATDSFTVEVIEKELPSGGGGGSGAGGTGVGKTSKDYVYTLDADFELGTLLNVNHDAPGSDQLQLNKQAKPFPFVYIANSARGTAVRIDVDTGTILGEYLTSPNGRSRNPSRTTVDKLGNVWVTNRDEGEFRTIDGLATNWGSTTRIGLVVGGTRSNADGTSNPVGEYLKAPFEYNTCVDKNGDGLIRTSRGLANILAWPNASGVDHDGGVETAVDECIQFYVRVRGTNTRTVAIDAENDAWIGGANNWHEEVDGDTGQRIPGTAFNLGCGGYGGLIDGNGILWSARYGSGLLRYDTVAKTGVCLGNSHGDYGLGVDPVTGHIWHTGLGGNFVAKLNPAATTQATMEIARYPHGNENAQGVAVDAKGNVWVAHALFGATTVGRLKTDGTYLGNAYLGGANGPTGVAVDANGKVWSANINTSNATRIDPEIGQLVASGGVPSGWYDLNVNLGAGAGPYNYSDMTGAVAVGTASPSGFWSIKQDGTALGTLWRKISWDGSTPGGTSITVEARAADTQTELPSTPFVTVTDGAALSGIVGRFIEVRATLQTTDPTATPILTDIRISANTPPVASDGTAVTSKDVPVDVPLVATDDEGDQLTFEVVDDAAHGAVTIAGAVATYTPDSGYTGPDSFTFKARDADADSNVATVTLTVGETNEPPVADDLETTTPEDTPLLLTLPASDPDGDALTLAYGQPAHGSYDGTTYTPAPNYHGPDSFTYTATDPDGESDGGTVTITVTPVNDPPVAADQAVVTDEDTPLAITLGATDIDADALTFATATAPQHGSWDGSTYTPAPDYHGPDSFTFLVSDGQGGSDSGTVTITVRPVNDPPAAPDASVTTPEDTPLAIALPASDPDGDALTLAYEQPTHGTYDGTTYTPAPNYHGPDSFTYTATDPDGENDGGTVTITVTPVNDPPVVADLSVSTDEDTPLAITLGGTDVDGDTLVITTTQPSHGSYSGSVYTPAPNYHGPDSFTYTADDGNGGTDTATVTITVRPVNDPPVADDQALETNEDTPLAITLGGTDVDGDTLTFAPATAPQHGTWDGSTYTPAPNYHGSDSFSFLVGDGQGGSDTGTITITVRPVNDPPVVADVSTSTDEDTPVAIPLEGTDLDGDTLTITTTQPTHGSYSAGTYTPAPNYHGPDAFTYTANDGHGGTDAATVTITVLPVNDPPVAGDDTAATDADTPLVLAVTTLLANDSDPDGDALAIANVGTAAHGTVELAGSQVTYTPAPGYSGPDSFTYTLSDGNGGSDTATVAVTVGAVEPAPLALVLDEESIDNGTAPNFFSSSAVNDQLARIGLRSNLPAFAGANVGRRLVLHSGQVGNEGWFALKTIPASWATAGPTSDGLQNYFRAGPGLGSGRNAERLLEKVPDVTPLRATGLKLLVGQRVCAVVYDSNVSINYGPLSGSLKGANLGVVALRVQSVNRLTGFSSSALPKVEVEVLDRTAACGGPLRRHTDAPAPISSSQPFDTIP